MLTTLLFLAAVPQPDVRQVDSVVISGDPYVRIEARANTFTFSAQKSPALAIGRDGSTTIAWESSRQLTGVAGAFSRTFDRLGRPIGPEIPATQEVKYASGAPAPVRAAGGVPTVFYESIGRDGQPVGVYVGDSQVNEKGLGTKRDLAVCQGLSGRTAVVYSAEVGHNMPRVFLRLYNAAGEPVTKPVRVTDLHSGRETIPSIAASKDGYLVVWQRFDGTGKPDGIWAQSIDSSGTCVGKRQSISDDTGIEPNVSSCGDGFVVGWVSANSDQTFSAKVLRIRGGLDSAKHAVTIAGQSGDQNGVAVAGRADGSFAVVWNLRSEGERDVYAQIFDTGAQPTSEPFVLTSAVSGDQVLTEASGKSRVFYGDEGSLTAVWAGDSGFQDKSAVNITKLVPASALTDEDKQLLAKVGARPEPLAPGAGESELPALKFVKMVAEGPGPHEPPIRNPLPGNPWGVVYPQANGGFNAFMPTTFTPPDCDMAVGPTDIVATVNDGIAFFKKDGTRTYTANMRFSNGFWGTLLPGDFVFDPECIYDTIHGRFWVMASIYNAPGSKSYLVFAVTATGDPNGTWYKYLFDTSGLAGNMLDSPNFGVDTNVLYMTGDGFGISSNYPVYTFDINPILAGNAPGTQRSTTLTTSTQSAGLPDVQAGSNPALYMIEHQEGSNRTQVSMIALRDPLTSPSFTRFTLTVPSYSSPTTITQLGSSVRPETFDARMWNCKFRNGHVWASQHQGSSRVLARWYDIDMRGWPTSGNNPVLVQSGNIDLGASIFTSFCSVAVDDQGNAAMAFARSSTTEFISSSHSTRKWTDTLGTMPTTAIDQAANAPENSGRWGDYSGCEADPAFPGAFWSHAEWADAGSWRTWIQPFYATNELWANEFSTFKGRRLSGGLAEIMNDDGTEMVHETFIRTNLSDPHVGVELKTATLKRNQTSATLRLVYRVDSPGYRIRTQLFDNVAGNFVELDARAASLSKTTLDVAVANPTRYVRSSDGKVVYRVIIDATGPIGSPSVRMFMNRWAWIEN